MELRPGERVSVLWSNQSARATNTPVTPECLALGRGPFLTVAAGAVRLERVDCDPSVESCECAEGTTLCGTTCIADGECCVEACDPGFVCETPFGDCQCPPGTTLEGAACVPDP